MNKRAIFIIGLVVLAGAGILYFQGARQQNQFGDKLARAAASLKPDDGQEVAVNITGFAFKSQIIKVKKGTKVVWTNRDDAPHSITSDEGGYLDSPIIHKDASYEKVFDTTGTFRYHCTPHPNMIAAVIVVD